MSSEPDTSNPTANLSAKDFVDQTISQAATVVVFSLSWCSYCRAMKNMLAQLEVDYRLHELDTPAYQEKYAAIRHCLADRARSSTLPQLFIGGELIGGYSEAYAAYRNGRLREILARHDISSTLGAD